MLDRQTLRTLPRILRSLGRVILPAAFILPMASSTPWVHAQSEPSFLSEARALVAQAKLSQAESLLIAGLKVTPANGEAHFLLGYVYFRQNRPTQSLAEYTLGAASRRPTPAELRIVGSDYVLLADFVDADRWFSQATEDAPGVADGWYLLGRTKYNEGKYADAARCFDRVLALNPRDVKAEDNLGLSWQALNRLREAQQAFETAIAWQHDSPVRSGAPYLDLGQLLLDLNQTGPALEALRQAALLSPKNPKAREQLGQAYKLIGNLPAARKELETAAQLAPKSSAIHFQLGQVYRRLGEKELGRRELDLSAQLTSTHSSTETPNIDRTPQAADNPSTVPPTVSLQPIH